MPNNCQKHGSAGLPTRREAVMPPNSEVGNEIERTCRAPSVWFSAPRGKPRTHENGPGDFRASARKATAPTPAPADLGAQTSKSAVSPVSKPAGRVFFALITLLACLTCAARDTCFECHTVMEGMSLKFTNDIHYAKAISCADCHGGDATETNQNISMNASRGFKVRVTRQGTPGFCASCHSNTAYMSRYEPHQQVDQFAQYQTSVHGRRLAAGRKRAAECVDCHSVHDTRAVADPLSTVNPKRITKTCAKCHAGEAGAFASSPHGRPFNNARLPGCTVCHSAHATEPATTAMLVGTNSVCLRCHQPDSPPIQLAADMAKVLTDLEAAGPDAQAALAQARIAVHSLNLSAVKQSVNPPIH